MTAVVGGMAPASAHPLSPRTPVRTSDACGQVAIGFVRCGAVVLDDPSDWRGRRVASATTRTGSPSFTLGGYGPNDLQSAYGLTSASATDGTGRTVAIVDAYDDPNAAADLAVYRSTENLPALCGTPYTGTTCAGSFRKVNQAGVSTYPKANAGWSQEISLDLDMISAICPHCSILLVEAASGAARNMARAANEAASAGVVAISNSYGGHEFSGETALDRDYDHPGIAVTASSGDNGEGVIYPAASPDVIAVGGTSLTNTGTSGAPVWSETAWSGAGSGCSVYESAPSWAFPTSTCPRRTSADVAAVADPVTGVAFYDTYRYIGWSITGGTSVSSPIIAAVYALAGGSTAAALYGPAASLRRVTTGTNAGRCKTYLCDAADSLSSPYTFQGQSYRPTWYNGPTGNGTPQGLGSF